MKLIYKDALVAEIERLHSVHSGKYGCDEVAINLEYLEDFLDTIEVKEVDKDCLTWEDLATIEKLGDDFVKHNQTPMSDEEFYKEVLKQFKLQK